jgi:hypothetical protein
MVRQLTVVRFSREGAARFQFLVHRVVRERRAFVGCKRWLGCAI